MTKNSSKSLETRARVLDSTVMIGIPIYLGGDIYIYIINLLSPKTNNPSLPRIVVKVPFI